MLPRVQLRSERGYSLHLAVSIMGKLSDTILNQFKAYIEAEERCKATEEFLFKNDWSKIQGLFSNEKNLHS